ncbi:hypothetical protein [Hymenobacter koreensis]
MFFLLVVTMPALAEAFKGSSMGQVLWTAIFVIFGVPVGLALLVYTYFRSDTSEDTVLQGGLFSTITVGCLTWWGSLFMLTGGKDSTGLPILLGALLTVVAEVLVCRSHRVPQ